MFLENYTFSETFLMAGLSFAEYLSKKEPEIYRPKLAVIQRNLGFLYSNMCTDENFKKFSKKSLKYYKQSIQNYEILYQQDPNVYREDLAKSQFGIALIYNDMMDYKNAEFFYASALGHFMLLCKENADVYKENLYLTLLNFTYLYIEESKFSFAHKNIDNTINVMPEEAKLYDLKGSLFLAENKKEEALAMWKKVLELNPDFLKENPDGTNLSNGLKKLGLIE